MNFAQDQHNIQEAYFAGGCFWCVESAFEKHEGVIGAISGFSGGEKTNPTYKEVASGKTKYREAVKILYDPTVISYKKLLYIFWRSIDPTDDKGQFVDKGFQYTSAIFYTSEEEKNLAEQTKKELIQSKTFSKNIVTEILPFTNFYKAEDYHQDYYKTNPFRYKFYYLGSGRPQFLEKTWKEEKDDSDEFPVKE